MDGDRPICFVVGGPNGAGKSTFALRYLGLKDLPYLCADEFAKQLNPVHLEAVSVEAGRQFVRAIDEMIGRRASFLVESTLSGRSFRRTLERCRESGYLIKAVLVFLSSAETCVARVAARVHRGGHHVPAADVRRRFTRSLYNFWTLYRPLVDRWYLVYNSGKDFESVADGEADRIVIKNDRLFDQFQKTVEGHQP